MAKITKITKHHIIEEFKFNYPDSKLRFLKFLVDNFRKDDFGLKEAKELMDEHWHDNGGKTIADVLIHLTPTVLGFAKAKD